MSIKSIWNIGAIAASGHPEAYDLIVNVVLASTAFPGIFPPILFNVERGGNKFQELHVDGGLTSQVFMFPINTRVNDILKEVGLNGASHVYVLRNAIIWPKLTEVDPSTFSILKQTAFSLVNAMALMDMHHIYLDALDNNLEFHIAYMPSDFREPDEPFDPAYMKELFTLAHERAINGYPWEDRPPEFQRDAKRPAR